MGRSNRVEIDTGCPFHVDPGQFGLDLRADFHTPQLRAAGVPASHTFPPPKM